MHVPAKTGVLLAMVMASLALQVAAIFVLHAYRFRTEDDHFGFGWEMGRVGRAIALGQGFSNPYGDSTGPTAWEPPLYPYLIGGVFKLFGVYSDASAVALLIINGLFTALSCIPIFFIARSILGEKMALWCAWIWALLPYEMYWSIHWVWDTTLSPFLHVEELLRAIEASPVSKEIGVVDDGSTDGTRDKLLALPPAENLTIVFHERNCGKGAAIRTGLQYARGEYVLIQDSDLEYDPQDYPALLQPLQEGKANVVDGVRPDDAGNVELSL